jgi:hypothetical protein
MINSNITSNPFPRDWFGGRVDAIGLFSLPWKVEDSVQLKEWARNTSGFVGDSRSSLGNNDGFDPLS